MKYQIPSKILSFDCESAGLNGPVFAIGYVVMENGVEIESDSISSGISEHSCECSSPNLRWLHENTPMDVLYPATQEKDNGTIKWTGSHTHLAQWFKGVLQKHSEALIITDVGYPVETGFLREIQAYVYPLIDVSSVLLARGIDPTSTFDRLENELPKHHPLYDARQSARVFLEQFKK